MACCWEDFLFLMGWHWREPRTSLFPSNTSFLNDRGTFAPTVCWYLKALIDDDPDGLSCVPPGFGDCNQFKTGLLSKSIVTNPDVGTLCYLLSIDFWCEGQYAVQWGRIKTEAWWVGGFTNHRCFYFEALFSCSSSGKDHSLERRDNILRILSPAKKSFSQHCTESWENSCTTFLPSLEQPDSAVQGVVEDWGHK